MPYITTDDLKYQALWMVGEPTDGTSDYDTQVVDYLQLVYDVFVTGSTLGMRDLATSAGLYSQFVNIANTDWPWFRKQPPYAFITTPACIGSGASVPVNQGTQIGTMTLTFNSTTVTFSDAPFWTIPGGASSVRGGRILVLSQAQGIPNPPITVPRVATHTIASTSLTLDAAWPQETQTVDNFVIWKTDYDVPSDFERFCEAWKVQGGYIGSSQPLNVGSYEQVMDIYPLTDSAQGPPSAAARMSPETLLMNRWDTFSYRIEGSYVFRPPTLEVNATPDLQEPLIPLRWRQVLAFGAAMLMSQDKVDSRVDAISSQFREIVRSMCNEYRKEQNSGSELSGRMLYRGNRNGSWRGLSTRSGLRFWP